VRREARDRAREAKREKAVLYSTDDDDDDGDVHDDDTTARVEAKRLRKEARARAREARTENAAAPLDDDDDDGGSAAAAAAAGAGPFDAMRLRREAREKAREVLREEVPGATAEGRTHTGDYDPYADDDRAGAAAATATASRTEDTLTGGFMYESDLYGDGSSSSDDGDGAGLDAPSTVVAGGRGVASGAAAHYLTERRERRSATAAADMGRTPDKHSQYSKEEREALAEVNPAHVFLTSCSRTDSRMYHYPTPTGLLTPLTHPSHASIPHTLPHPFLAHVQQAMLLSEDSMTESSDAERSDDSLGRYSGLRGTLQVCDPRRPILLPSSSQTLVLY